MTIGDRLREERERLGFSQPALSGLAETTKKSQIDYEKGISFPKANYLEVIARAGADIQYIVTGVRSVSALASDEEQLLQQYRLLDAESKRRTLAMVYGGTPPQVPNSTFQVTGNVGSQVGSIAGGKFNIDMRKDKK